jgi:hypothetical protein
VANDQEHAVFQEKMARGQAHLDRYQSTGNQQLLFDPRALAEVRELPGYATGSATWGDAQHVVAWFHWLRYEALGDSRSPAERQAAEQLFRDQYRVRPPDLPAPVRQQLDSEFQRLFASVWPRLPTRRTAVAQSGVSSESSSGRWR